MIKNKWIYICFPVLLFSGCSGDDNGLPARQDAYLLQLAVSADKFVVQSESGSRATDTGSTTVFEEGDRVGVTVKDAGGKLLFDNVPYKYKDAGWSFDRDNDEGKGPCFYDSKAVSYIVYYPYSPLADGMTDESALRNCISPRSVQSTREEYRASDLMVCVVRPAQPSASLNVSLKHVYACISLSVGTVTYQLADGVNTSVCVTPAISDVGITVGGLTVSPCREEAAGAFRCIVPTGSSSGEMRCFYTLDNRTYIYTVGSGTGKISGGTRYIIPAPVISGGTYSPANARLGDFYCRSSDGTTGYLLPGGVSEEVLKMHSCIGVVFRNGKHVSDTDSYTDVSGVSMEVHGYAVALKNAGDYSWGPYGTNCSCSTSSSDWRGYYNQKQIAAKAAGNLSNWPAANACATWGVQESNKFAAPGNSSGWFLPSCGQLFSGIYRNRDLIDKQCALVEGSALGTAWFWSSSEYPGYPGDYAWYVGFDYGYYDWYRKDLSGGVRAVLAF